MTTISVSNQKGALADALAAARAKAIRELTLKLEPGYHSLDEALTINARDWDSLRVEGAEDARSTVGSGQAISGWQKAELNGRDVWVANVLPGWRFRQLFVEGKRQTRAQWPKPTRSNPSFKRLAAVARQDTSSPLFPAHDDPANRFKLDEEDMDRGAELIGSEVVCLHHWLEERHPIVAIDNEGWLVSSKLGVCAKHEHGKYARYYIDNLRTALTEVGEWYLDYELAKLYYRAPEGVDPNDLEVIAPTLTHLVKIDGIEQGEEQGIRFDGVSFAHSEWQFGYGGRQKEIHRAPSEIIRSLDAEGGYAGFCQAAASMPAAIEVTQTSHLEFTNCVFEHLGAYALFIGEGCHYHVIENCHFRDLGAGSIHFSADLQPENNCPVECCGDEAHTQDYSAITNTDRTNSHHRVEQNHFEDGGHVFHSGIPILMRHTSYNVVRGNEIHDFYYSGISCGWVWHFGSHPSHHNLIENNHIYSLGHRWLSDMAGVYILGEQEGTIVRGNRIHDVFCQAYGAWGVYLDHSASHVLVEKNICYGPLEEGFVIHFGKHNEVRHNIFAFGSGGAMHIGKGDEETAQVDFHHNILLVNDGAVYKGGYKMDWCKFTQNLNTHHNLIWNYGSEPLKIDNLGARNLVDVDPDAEDGEGNQWMVEGEAKSGVIDWLSFEQWQELGYDEEATIADPLMVDPLNGDFRIRKGSPAEQLGFTAEVD